MGRKEPAAKRQAIGCDRAAFEKRYVIERLKLRSGLNLAEHATERAIYDDTQCALDGIMSMEQHDGLAEMIVA